MKSKFISTIVCFFAALLAFPITCFAADNDIAGVFVNKPEMLFEFRAETAKEDDFSNIRFDNEILNINNIESFEFSKHSVCCYVLVDISGSVPQTAINAVKDSLIDYYRNFGDDDKLILYTVGSRTKEVLSGDEPENIVNDAINTLSVTNENSYIYSALDYVYDKAANNIDYDRKYVLVISDGINWSNETSYSKVYKKYSLRALPIYELIFSKDILSTASNDSLSEFKDLAIDSGGVYQTYKVSNANQAFSKLINDISNVCLVFCSAETNYIEQSAQDHVLSFNYKNNNQKLFVNAQNYITDDTAPVVNAIDYNTEKKEFEILFSENIFYDSNNIKNSVTISKGNKKVNIINFRYSEELHTLYLMTDEMQYSGNYKFELENITDYSNEKNAIADHEISKKIKAAPPFFKFVKDTWWIAIIVLFLVALLCILLFLKKKKHVKKITELFETQIEEENVEVKHQQVVKQQHYINASPNNKKLTMFVQTNNDKETIDFLVVSSIIVGRAGHCDLCIADPKLSRQHFVIQLSDKKFSINNLSNTNGTYLNGNKLTAWQQLHDGDKIVAGTSFITVRFEE